VIEDICRIESELQSLALINLKSLTERCVEIPKARSLDRAHAEIAAGAGLCVLKHKSRVAAAGVRHRHRLKQCLAASAKRLAGAG